MKLTGFTLAVMLAAFEMHRRRDVRRWKIAETAPAAPIYGVKAARDGNGVRYTYFKVEDRVF